MMDGGALLKSNIANCRIEVDIVRACFDRGGLGKLTESVPLGP